MFFARFVFFLCLWRGINAKWGINRPKTPQNHSRQRRKTKVSELYSSDWFWGWNVTLCGIYETFNVITCVLPRSTVANYKQCKTSTGVSNNWRHASNPQGCLPVGSPRSCWRLESRCKVNSSVQWEKSRWNRRGSAGRIETSKLGSRGVASNAQVWESYVFPCAVTVPVRHLSHGKKCNLQSDVTANNMLDSIAAVTRNGIDNKLLHLRAYSLTKTLT